MSKQDGLAELGSRGRLLCLKLLPEQFLGGPPGVLLGEPFVSSAEIGQAVVDDLVGTGLRRCQVFQADGGYLAQAKLPGSLQASVAY